MKNAIDFNQEICSFKDNLRNFALSFTKDADDADDLVQETFLKAIRYASKFQEGTNLKAWLYMILKNTFINNYRRNAKVRSVFTENLDNTPNKLLGQPTTNRGIHKFVQEDINGALSRLPRENSVPFLRYFEGYKYYEIATELNIPIGTVKTRIHVARKMLKRDLKMYHDQFSSAVS